MGNEVYCGIKPVRYNGQRESQKDYINYTELKYEIEEILSFAEESELSIDTTYIENILLLLDGLTGINQLLNIEINKLEQKIESKE